jgi:hypothetical protein
VYVWLRTPVGWKNEIVMGNCERSTCVWKLPDCKNVSVRRLPEEVLQKESCVGHS